MLKLHENNENTGVNMQPVHFCPFSKAANGERYICSAVCALYIESPGEPMPGVCSVNLSAVSVDRLHTVMTEILFVLQNMRVEQC
jgi:hypothetical protein